MKLSYIAQLNGRLSVGKAATTFGSLSRAHQRQCNNGKAHRIWRSEHSLQGKNTNKRSKKQPNEVEPTVTIGSNQGL